MSWPTIRRRRALSNSLASLLRRVGSSTVLRTGFIGTGPLALGLASSWGSRVNLAVSYWEDKFCHPGIAVLRPFVQMTRHPRWLPIPCLLNKLDALARDYVTKICHKPALDGKTFAQVRRAIAERQLPN